MILLTKEKCNTFFEKDDIKKVNKDEKLKKIEELIRKYEEEVNYGYIECPHCKSEHLIFYGHYERNIGIYGEYYKIRIKRVRCKHCGRTHALLPSFILPYYQNEVSFIEVTISLKIINDEGIEEISRICNVSRQIINNWIRRFKSHLTRLKVTISTDLEKIMTSLFDVKIREEYQKKNQLRFMEKVPT